VLELALGRIAIDAELKEDGYVARVAELLADFAADGGELIVTSFIDRVIAQLTASTPKLRSGLLVDMSFEHVIDRARASGAKVVLPEMRLVDDALIAQVAAEGLDLVVWGFMASEHASLLDDARVSGVITDDTEGALAARERR